MNYINTPCSLNSIKGVLETDGHVMGTMVIFPSQCRNLGSESLSYLPKLTHLVSGRVRIWVQAVQFQNPFS